MAYGESMKNSIKSNLVHGVGVRDAGYPVRITSTIDGKRQVLWRCPIYQAWSSMLRRCYSDEFQVRRPTYIGCTVVPEWLTFSAFRAWMVAQDHKGKQLDKDILEPGNKTYSPDSCVFVSSQLNSFMLDHGATRGEWPIGVYWHKPKGKFMARCRNPLTGRHDCLGYFSDPNMAHDAWRSRKHQHACTYADQQTDPRIAKALRSRYAEPISV